MSCRNAAYSSHSRSAIAEIVDALGVVEQRQRNRGDLARMVRFPRAALRQLDHRAPADVGIAIDARDVTAMLVDVVEQHALAQARGRTT